jgi:hypothetical protein
MVWRDVLDAAVKVIGFGLTVILSGGVIFLVYRALSHLLERLIGDKVIAQAGAVLTLVLLGLKGLSAALSYITQPEVQYLHRGLMGLLDDMAAVIQWVVMIVALLFVGYALRGWRGPAENEEAAQK